MHCCVLCAVPGVDVNAQDSHGRTAAHWCVVIQNAYLLRVLLISGAQPSVQDTEGQTPLHLTIRTAFKDGILAIGKSCPIAVCTCPIYLLFLSSFFFCIAFFLLLARIAPFFLLWLSFVRSNNFAFILLSQCILQLLLNNYL